MKRMLRLVLSGCLGLLVPVIIFPWLVQALAPGKKVMPTGSFTPAPDSSHRIGNLPPTSALKPKPSTE